MMETEYNQDTGKMVRTPEETTEQGEQISPMQPIQEQQVKIKLKDVKRKVNPMNETKFQIEKPHTAEHLKIE